MLAEALALHRAMRGDGPATADAVLATAQWYADTVAAAPDTFDAGETERAAAMVAAVEADMSRRIGDASLEYDRTSAATERPRIVTGAKGRQYAVAGHVSSADRARAMGRGTEADEYEVLDGAPVGCPESLAARRAVIGAALAEVQAERSEAYWNARIEARNAGLSKSQRRRARRGVQR